MLNLMLPVVLCEMIRQLSGGVVTFNELAIQLLMKGYFNIDDMAWDNTPKAFHLLYTATDGEQPTESVSLELTTTDFLTLNFGFQEMRELAEDSIDVYSCPSSLDDFAVKCLAHGLKIA